MTKSRLVTRAPSGRDPVARVSVATRMTANAGKQGAFLSDGRILALSPHLLAELGFRRTDDLRGLRFDSFWHPTERPSLSRAIQRAKKAGSASVTLDLSYVAQDAGPCRVVLEATDDAGLMTFTLDRSTTSQPTA